ncbi:hypothetical protein AB0001_004779 [Salmonella enterica]|nr:hypothetical protein [Salmonella enterica]EEP3373015.1 hypothetical protein [Salmonella enterica]EFP6579722.1 hypothetical protein [Salmonella enterica]EGC7971005.1 hypothetical protein [Salmonella enterica]EIV4461182.1 hypothetical protein [Salmonella enterica]
MKKFEVHAAVIHIVCSKGHAFLKLERHNGSLVLLHKEKKNGRWEIRYLKKFRKEITPDLFSKVMSWVEQSFQEAKKIGVGYYKGAKAINIFTGKVVERW